MIKQLHIVPDLAVLSGGLGLASLRFSESVAKAGADVTLMVSSKGNAGELRPAEAVPNFNLISHAFHDTSCAGILRKYQAIFDFCDQHKVDLIHLHGVWLPLYAAAAIVSKRLNIPYVVSPHGCFEPWALGYKRNKKLLALYTYQGLVNRNSAMFFATSDIERINLRKLGLRAPIALIPNGVDLVELGQKEENRKKNTILFLSRIHPVKGLLNLVEAWSRIRDPRWSIIIAGPDELGHQTEVEELIRKHNLCSDFQFVGVVDGDAKDSCFRVADIFVLPTFSENFGIAVAEALAHELPVITTTGAPWSDLESFACGWWVSPNADSLTSALKKAINTPKEELREMGKRGRNLVELKYSWEKIGKDGLSAYEWVLGKTSIKPNLVEIKDI